MRMVPPNRKTSKFQGIMQHQRGGLREHCEDLASGPSEREGVRCKMEIASGQHHASHPRSVEGHWILFSDLFLVLIWGFYNLNPNHEPTKYIVNTEPYSSPKVCSF